MSVIDRIRNRFFSLTCTGYLRPEDIEDIVTLTGPIGAEIVNIFGWDGHVQGMVTEVWVDWIRDSPATAARIRAQNDEIENLPVRKFRNAVIQVLEFVEVTSR